MTVRILTVSGTNTPHGYSLSAGDSLIVAPGTLVVGATGDGVNVAITGGSSHYARIFGSVIGTDDGLEVGEGNTNFSILVGNTGLISGYWGIYAPGRDDLRVTNFGSITGVNTGVFATGDRAVILNYGDIDASAGGGVQLGSHTGTDGTESRLINFGTVSGPTHSVFGYGGSDDIVRNHGTLQGYVELMGGADTLANRGDIVGNIDMGTAADLLDNRYGQIDGDIHMGDGADTLFNQGGTMTGTVWLDEGNDIYDGRSGAVTGVVYGGIGNDTFIGNALAAETFDGGDGTDQIDFRFGPAVTIALDQSFDNDGAAIGDSYTGFENVLGSARADMIRGNASANVLNALSGNDDLEGAAGADTLYGQNGNDTLSGGADVDALLGGSGNDVFLYDALGDRGDSIADFSNVAGNNDRFWIDASEFGGGLAAGALAAADFRIRVDNVAQDASDRFIFRSSDTTLWFDADGNGAGAPLMVADLQVGATMTAADILLI
ncbi:hypothetical protein C8J30_11067 [Rhodobacter viridis]|uniref:Hemolysin type calcium-binding protein n=1 Tax=Rhodobacter viridis TaxID=1054202 RepID=A0A318TX23_9RHOB|nr:calcium-binding protein [Rhodobacter viridis]PYF09194.1 hypothetical protein C8J30_11067 [Rhodobacter viridis]